MFRNNHVSATLDSYDRKSSIEMHDRAGGGCISVEYGAGLHLRDATSTGDTVMASDGDGGFLCARFADQILLQNVNISKASSGKEGGGGALAVYATKIALDLVEIETAVLGRRVEVGSFSLVKLRQILSEAAFVWKQGERRIWRERASRCVSFERARELVQSNVACERARFP